MAGETGTEKRMTIQEFKDRLKESEPENVQDRFYQIEAEKRAQISEELKGRPPAFSLEEMENILKEARLQVTAESMGIKDLNKWRKKNEGKVYRGGED